MFPADRGRRWHLFLTNSPVTLCVCKTISSVPTSVNFSELSSKHSQWKASILFSKFEGVKCFQLTDIIVWHFKYAITCVYSLTSATGIQKVCTTCYWQVNIYIYKHGIICKFWKLPNLFSSPIWPELPSKYPVKSKHLVVQIWRRRMFPADRGRIWDLFLTNSSVALCICKAISSVPTSVNFNN